MKKYLKLFSLLFIVLLVGAGCSLTAKEKTYSVNGINVTMKDGFYEKELVSLTAYLESSDSIFTALKEEKATLKEAGLENITLKEYAEAVVEANGLKEKDIIEKDGLTYFTYEKEVSGKTYFYLASVYQTNDAFWLVNFACDTKNKDSFQEDFIKWAKTVNFS